MDNKLYTLAGEGNDATAVLLQPKAKGLDAPSFTINADEYPAIPGGFVRSVRAGIREIFLPLKIVAPTRPEMMRLKRKFIASLNPSQGLVSLIVTEYTQYSPGGPWEAEPARQLTCYYVSGAEGGEESSAGVNWTTYGLVLRATDPYFRGLARATASFVRYGKLSPFIAETGSQFLSPDGVTPGDGLVLSANPEWITSQVVTNVGEVAAQPRWWIEGPLASTFSIHLADLATETARTLRFNKPVTLTTDDAIFIETAKGELDIYKQRKDGNGPRTPLWGAVDITSELWALESGENIVELAIDKPPGMTPAEELDWLSRNRPVVSLSYLPGYLGI
ncbi:hypothetical protein ACIBG8_19620 [Nonomuraea sp. NPDC050556]|uniref:hypothetical protein n=1 Tax=Nonomuraea sp. NPDC050556 TaxID=3364369 RepID=UPI0037B1BDDF